MSTVPTDKGGTLEDKERVVIALLRLTAWLNDHGHKKNAAFVQDMHLVLRCAARDVGIEFPYE